MLQYLSQKSKNNQKPSCSLLFSYPQIQFPLRVKLLKKMIRVAISNHFPLIVFWLSTKILVSMFSSKYQVSLSFTNNLHNSKPTNLCIQFHIVSLICILYLMQISTPSLKFFLYWSWEISCFPSYPSDSLATHSLCWLLFSSKSLMSSDICLHKWYNSVALNTIFMLLYTKLRSLTSTAFPWISDFSVRIAFFFFPPGVYRIGILNLKCLNQHFWSHKLNHYPTQSSLSHKQHLCSPDDSGQNPWFILFSTCSLICTSSQQILSDLLSKYVLKVLSSYS